jgi:hypothetical protein
MAYWQKFSEKHDIRLLHVGLVSCFCNCFYKLSDLLAQWNFYSIFVHSMRFLLLLSLI